MSFQIIKNTPEKSNKNKKKKSKIEPSKVVTKDDNIQKKVKEDQKESSKVVATTEKSIRTATKLSFREKLKFGRKTASFDNFKPKTFIPTPAPKPSPTPSRRRTPRRS